MILNHYCFENGIDFDMGPVQQLVIECPELMGRVLREMHLQSLGLDGGFILFEKNREYDFSKHVEVIVDPFDADPNKKIILNGLVKSIQNEMVSEKHYMETHELTSSIQRLVLEIATDIDSSADVCPFELESLVKGSKPRFIHDGTFKDMISEYLRLVQKFTDTRLCILFNISIYLSKEDWNDIISQVRYYQQPVLIVENKISTDSIPAKIIDIDLCEIDIG